MRTFGGLFLICVGVWAIWARRALSEIAEAAGRWHGHLFGRPTPRLPVLWGIGVIVVGIIVLLG